MQLSTCVRRWETHRANWCINFSPFLAFPWNHIQGDSKTSGMYLGAVPDIEGRWIEIVFTRVFFFSGFRIPHICQGGFCSLNNPFLTL